MPPRLVWNYYTQSPWTRDGKVRAEQVGVTPQVSGSILQLNVRDNQLVKAGDVLFRIDDTPYKIALLNARAQLAKAKAEVARAQAEQKSRQRCQPSASSITELYLGRRFRKRQYRAEYRHDQPRSR